MDTQQKYNEAEYFLGMMKENIDNRQKFEYNVNAFVSAARSVTSVLQKDCSKYSEFDEWYCKTQLQMKRNELFKFFKKNRDYSIHEGTINMKSNIEIEVPSLEIQADMNSVEAIVRKANGTIKDYECFESPVKSTITSKQDDKEIIEYRWVFKNSPNEYRNVGVITLCNEYLNGLKVIVDDAENKFSEMNAS